MKFYHLSPTNGGKQGFDIVYDGQLNTHEKKLTSKNKRF